MAETEEQTGNEDRRGGSGAALQPPLDSETKQHLLPDPGQGGDNRKLHGGPLSKDRERPAHDHFLNLAYHSATGAHGPYHGGKQRAGCRNSHKDRPIRGFEIERRRTSPGGGNTETGQPDSQLEQTSVPEPRARIGVFHRNSLPVWDWKIVAIRPCWSHRSASRPGPGKRIPGGSTGVGAVGSSRHSDGIFHEWVPC